MDIDQQQKIFSAVDLKFKAPFCLTISGQSDAGKSTVAMQFVRKCKTLMNPPPKSILYCYGVYNNYIPELQKMGVKINSGLPSDELIESHAKPMLLIMDDLMLQLNQRREYIAELVTRRSHHSNISIIFIVQNLFEKNFKIVRDNSQLIILLNSPSAALQIRSLGVQLFPGKNGLAYFLSAYQQAVQRPYGYLLIDLHPASDSRLRLRTNIFGEESFQTIFLPH